MKLFINLFLLILSYNFTFAQDGDELQKRKKILIEEIKLSNRLLEKTQNEKGATLEYLKTLKLMREKFLQMNFLILLVAF